MPPVGTVFLAWANRERVRHWLAGVGSGATAAQRERYLDALAVVRDRGYSVAVGSAGSADAERPHDIDDYLLFELREAQRLPVAHIAAPVFDPEGTVRLALTVVAFHDQLTSQDVPIVAKRLVTATTRVARATWGVADTGDDDLVAALMAPGDLLAERDGTGTDESGGNSPIARRSTGSRRSRATRKRSRSRRAPPGPTPPSLVAPDGRSPTSWSTPGRCSTARR